MTKLGISSSRIFSVGTLPESLQQQPNTSLGSAMPLSVDSICNGVLTDKSVDHYSFQATAGQRIIVDCAAKGIDSKMNAVVIVADAEGRDLLVQRRGGAIDFQVPADGLYIIKVHDLTFKGGAEFFYRLALLAVTNDAPIQPMPGTAMVNSVSWPPVGLAETANASEVEPNNEQAQAQPITLPCDLSGNFFPAADVDTFQFVAKQGEVWWIEVGSARLGLLTDPAVVVQHVSVDDQGNETLSDVAQLGDIPSPIKVSSNAYSYDGPPYDAGSADVLGKVEIKQDGIHRLQLSDLFGGTRNDPNNVYRLIIRKAAPDFAVVGWALHMNLRNGDRNALSKPIALRRGATMPLEVVAVRRDGFDGEIELTMTDLPDGVTASGLKIPEGQSRGMMLITADEGAPPGCSISTFLGRGEIDGKIVERLVVWLRWHGRYPMPGVKSRPRDSSPMCRYRSAKPNLLRSRSRREEKIWEVTVGQQLTIPLIHMRRSEFSGATLGLSTLGVGFDQTPSFDVPLTADSGAAVLDLAKLKTPPGDYTIAFYGSAVASYLPPADAAAGSEPAQPAKAQDIVNIIVSEPITIRVKPSESK